MTNFVARSAVYNQLHQELLREAMRLKSLFVDDLCLYLYNSSGAHLATPRLALISPSTTMGSPLVALEHSVTKMKLAGFVEHLRERLTAEFAQNQPAPYDKYMIDVFTDYIVVHMETESPAFTVRIWELCGRYKELYGADLCSKIPLNYQNIYLVKCGTMLSTK